VEQACVTLTAERLLGAGDEKLRACGLSAAKLAALRDLAAKTLDGTVPAVEELNLLGDDAIVDRLTQIRGIGRWTVQMLLIFRLGRPDVLPIDDYGVRKGFALAYRKKELPTPKELAAFGERWRPYRTVASWYLWRVLDKPLAKPGDV
ncbi:MAG: DNA-3-methyladenine glycosylase family protein, partial [Polyangiaceae bacterium]